MSLWTMTDAASAANTVVTATITGGITATTTSTAGLVVGDAVSGTGIQAMTTIVALNGGGTTFTLSAPATNAVGVTVTAVHKNVNKPKNLRADQQANVFGVSPAEAVETKVTHTGWIETTTGSGGRAGRVQRLTLVASGSIVNDAENTAYADPVIAVTGQPTAQTIRVAAGVTVGSPVTLGATVTVTGAGVTTYQWQVSSNGTNGWTDVVNSATTTGATTNTLTNTAESVLTEYYRLIVTLTTKLGMVTSTTNTAQFIGAQQCASTTWATGFVTVTAVAHRMVTGDTPTLAGFTPAGYNGVKTITVTDANTFTYPEPTNPGAVTVYGTETWADIDINASLTWLAGVATVTTTLTSDFVTGDSVVIAGVTPAGYNGTFVITKTGTTTFTYPLAADPVGAASVMGTSTVTLVKTVTASPWTSNKVLTTVTAHGYVGTPVLNFGGFTPAGYNATGVTATVFNANTLLYPVAGTLAVVSVEGYVYA